MLPGRRAPQAARWAKSRRDSRERFEDLGLTVAHHYAMLFKVRLILLQQDTQTLSLVPARNLVHGRSFDFTAALAFAEEASMSLASLTIRLLTALVLAAPIAACDVFQGKQSVPEYADDSNITNTIRARFVEDPVVHFGEVGVTTLNGNVRLTGQVNSDRERQRAVQIAQRVKGVRSVSNEIGIR